MGTFHDTKDPLHGITVVATAGDTVYVGRCHVRENGQIVLLDVDQHAEGEDDKSNAAWLERAARFGVWKKHERLVLSADEVTALAPLSEYFRRPGQQSGPAPVPAAGATGVAASADFPVAAPAAATASATATAPAADAAPVVLTPAAITEVRRLIADENRQDQGLRLAVAGGGCSGLVYKVEFDSRRDGDVVVPCDGFDVLMDRKSTIYLRGITLDHQKGLSGRGFQFQNPNASNTCGCGESFSV